MARIMIVVGSVRPGRIGLVIAEWVHAVVAAHSSSEVDFADLREIGLPFMDEPNHPRLHQYIHQHTRDWSARVAAADAFIFVTPEYNHSFSPALKNAVDYLHGEWARKPVTFVSYGGVSAGTRGVISLKPSLVALGLVPTRVNIELPFASRQIDDLVFHPTEHQEQALVTATNELIDLSEALAPLRPAN